jgi:multidrug efflux pump subunit AcrA (membrane-fusion protein)
MRLTLTNLLQTRAPAANLLIRAMVGGIFLSEGLRKFLSPAELGSGRFKKIGIAAPGFFGSFVGLIEMICGLLLTGAYPLFLHAKGDARRVVPVLLLFTLLPAALSGQTPPAPAPPVTFTVALAPWEKKVTLPAEAGPFYRISLGTPATGWVAAIKADAGSRVKKGDLLAAIDAPELVAARDARAEEARAAAQKIEQARAMLASAEAIARASESEFARLRDLAESGTVTSKVRDESEARAEASRAGVAEARAGVAAAEAEALASAARVTEAAAALAYTQILAPYDGLVVSRRAELGDFLDGGAKGADLFTFEQTDPLRVRLYVPEHAATLTKAGQAVTLRLGGQEFAVEVARVSGSLDPVTRTVTAEIDLKGTDLLPGTFGSATMTLAKLESAALVPLNAVRTGADASRYVVVLEGESPKNVPVIFHTTEGTRAVLTGDLVAGQIVILP